MEGIEVRKLTELEDQHWWYRERRNLLARQLTGLTPGTAVDVGAAGGGNTRVLQGLGWDVAALEFGQDGAQVCHERAIPVVRGDATRLPLAPGSLDLVVAYDVLEHLDDDKAAATGIFEALRPGGAFLIAVPCDPRLWSAHDDAVGHVRRYTRQTLSDLLLSAGFRLSSIDSWNVLLRPVVALRRRSSTGSDLEYLPKLVNTALYGVVALERHLPVRSWPGVSLFVKATRPIQ